MSEGNSDAPNVKIIPPLVYLAGIIVGLPVSMWVPTKVVPNSAAWIIGGFFILCGAVVGWFCHFEIQGRRDDSSTRPCRQ